MKKFADRVLSFGQSTIDSMTALCFEHKSLILAAGTPGFDTPEYLKQLAKKYIDRGHNQYTVNRGSRRLRRAIAEIWSEPVGRQLDPEAEITITCGATEALLAVAMAVVDPGDRVIVLEPFYENFKNIVLLSGGVPDFVPLVPPRWEPDLRALREKAPGAKMIIVNSPHNPTGTVLDEDILAEIARIAVENDLFVLSDETYRGMVFDIEEPNSLASFPGMAERTAVVSSFSKIMTATGWRVGFFIAAPEFTAQIRKVHDFASICAPAPFQDAVAEFLTSEEFPKFFRGLMDDYRKKRDTLTHALKIAGFDFATPQGAYYVLADFSRIKPEFDDYQMAEFMARDVGVCAVGGRAFFATERGKHYLRFSFARKFDEINEAAERISAMAGKL